MPFYRQMGSIPRKRHIEHRVQPGYRGEGLYYEEVITTQCFSRAYSIAYHLKPPTRVKHVEAAGQMPAERAEVPVLRHHHLQSGGIAAKGDPVTGRVPMFINADVTLYLDRTPTGEWIAMRSGAVNDSEGIAVAEVVQLDAAGRYGRSLQALVTQTA